MFTFQIVLPDKLFAKDQKIFFFRQFICCLQKFCIWQHCLQSKQRISDFNRNLSTQLFSREQMKWAFGKEAVIANRFCKSCIKPSNQNNLFFSMFSTIYRINTDGFGKHFCGFSGRFYPQLFGKEAEIANRFCKSCIWIGWHLHHKHDDGP